MATRRSALRTLAALAAAPVAGAAATRPLRIGFLRIESPLPAHRAAFEEGLREHGFVPGRDVLVDYRSVQGDASRLEALAGALVAEQVDLVVAAGNQAVRAARKATSKIPIVMAVANDPVASGLVASLAHPGGNVTGNTIIGSTLSAKRLELLREALPGATSVGVLVNDGNAAHRLAVAETAAAASRLGLVVVEAHVFARADFEGAFAALVARRAGALLVLEDALFATERVTLIALAAAHRLPSLFGQRDSVEAGGLASYGPNIADAYRNAAAFVARIARGARPADLPVEQPTRIELVVNLRTAKALGVTFPPSVLSRADEVIE